MRLGYLPRVIGNVNGDMGHEPFVVYEACGNSFKEDSKNYSLFLSSRLTVQLQNKVCDKFLGL